MADPYGYDELLYPCAPYPYTHPDHLATLAVLFGIETGSIECGRVLEVGCADGANLISMSMTMPGSRFTGIDLSQNQIEAGRRLTNRLGLRNVEIIHGDLADFTTDEPFDWIIAHGFYSWTPRETRSSLFETCRKHLTPNGVAFVSYNVLPGWQLRLALRRWLLQMIDQGRSTAERLRLARSCLLNLSDILSHATDDRRFTQLRAEVTQLEKWSDAYLRHDLLEDFNDPVMFVDFVAHAREYGLKFFAEAEFATMVGNDLPPTVSHRLSQLNCAQIQREQLIDMLTNRTFRQSLLCREAQRPRDRLGPDTVRLLYAVSTLKEISETSSAEATLPTFRSRTGFEVSPGNPVCREALRELAQRWPAGEFVIQLTKSARDRLRTSNSHEVERDFESDVDELCIILLAGFAERSVELHVAKPPFETAPSETPEASPLARAQAEVQNWVSSLRHDLVPLNDKQRLLVRHLDGTRCRPELLQLLTRAPQHLDLEPINEVINSSWIDLQLHWAARRGLLCPTR